MQNDLQDRFNIQPVTDTFDAWSRYFSALRGAKGLVLAVMLNAMLFALWKLEGVEFAVRLLTGGEDNPWYGFVLFVWYAEGLLLGVAAIAVALWRILEPAASSPSRPSP